MVNDRRKTGWILAAASIIMFSPLAMVLIGYNIPVLQNLGFARDSFAPLTIWVLAIIVAVGYIVYTFRVIPFVASMQREISLFKLLGIVSAVVGGIVEEAVFRRWLMDSLMYGGFGPVIQIVSSGVLFGMAHAAWLLARREFKFAIPAMSSTAVLGALLAAIYLLGGRNLGPCIFAHVLINIVIEPWLMLSSVSGKWKTLQ
ncbi:MAG: CPBP family intramembrane glutamic endopeptidase [Bacteroidota bacterium]